MRLSDLLRELRGRERSGLLRPGQQLYFLHIHKTAGASFSSLLETYFNPAEVCQAYQWHELLSIPPDTLRGYRLFRGHFHYCFHTLLPHRPVMITLLRHPVERVLSRYAHLQTDANHYLYPHVAGLQMGLQEFLNNAHTRPQVNNLQVRTIAFDFDIRAVASSVGKPLTARLEMEQKINSMLTDLPDDDLLQVAKDRLDEFAFVGITERFKESAELLAHTFGWPQAEMAPSINVSQNRLQRSDIAPEVSDQILDMNQADLALYEYALNRFEKDYQAMPAG